MFLTCLLGSFSPNYSSCPMFSYFFLSGSAIHYWKWGSEIPIIIVLLSIFPFRSVSICLIYWYLGTLVMGSYVFPMFFLINWSFCHYIMILFVSSCHVWLTVHFVCYKLNCPALFCFACVCTVFFCPFTLTESVSLKLKLNWTSYRKHVVGSCLFFFLNSSTNCIFLIEVFHHLH